MGGLAIFLWLSITTQLTLQTKLGSIKHHNEVFKSPKPRENLQKVGKFRQSVIGPTTSLNTFKFKGVTQAKSHLKTQKNKKIRSEELLKEFEDFRSKDKQNSLGELVKTRVARNDSIRERNIIEELQKLVTTTDDDISEVPQENTTSLSGEEEEVRTETIPPPLSLTSDQQKRAEQGEDSQDFPQEDGTFVIDVVGMTVCTIAGVVGLGCFIHKPTCPRPPSPFSDCSPSFQSAKLAFSSSPDEKINNTHRNNLKSGNKGSDKKSNSRSEKFLTGLDQDSLRSAGSPRQESLIKIDPDEEDDDLIYECPGLAPHGEMEVTNPFFLGKDFNMNVGEGEAGEKAGHSLINTNNIIRHGTLRAAGQTTQ